jgi:glycine/D-amino acid oxidase-like deaminating enzyme
MVPGAAMHIMSQRSTLKQIFVDTCQEIGAHVLEQITNTSNIDNFNVKPPYFALHLFRCIGPSASWDERMSFLEFMRHFVVISMLSGEKEAHERGSLIQQLARSNRLIFLEALKQNSAGKELSQRMGTNKGFLSLHRTHKAALHAEQEGKDFNEASELVSIEDAIELEPRIANLPMARSLYAVHRKDDYTANSAVFVKDLVGRIKAQGVEYKCGDKGTIQGIVISNHSKQGTIDKETRVLATSARTSRFRVTTEDGGTQNFDYVVLAAGVNTPLLAKKIEVENAPASVFKPSICPTYPLRGYSLTVYTNHTKQEGDDRSKKGRSSNLLNKPISVDDMYCSSVGANMARMAGFGELVGYRDKAKEVPSLAPKILARYCRTIFPESDAKEEHALQCFRPMTPDDIPLVGRVSSVPGLYLHSGHCTLGWTLCLATAECVAQDVLDDITGRENESYTLPGDLKVEKAKLSPNRFL